MLLQFLLISKVYVFFDVTRAMIVLKPIMLLLATYFLMKIGFFKNIDMTVLTNALLFNFPAQDNGNFYIIGSYFFCLLCSKNFS